MLLRILVSIAFFTVTSLLSFSVWAFAGSRFNSEPAMYTACALILLGMGGPSLLPATNFRGKQAVKFCLLFAMGFLAYSFLWSLSWFTFRGPFGEVVGSVLGLLVLVAILRAGMRFQISLLIGTAILFFFHTLGYSLGGFLYQAVQNRGPWGFETGLSPDITRHVARLAWGGAYGLGFGAGLTALLYRSRQ